MAATGCSLYNYDPSLPLAMVAAVLFSSLVAILSFRTIQTRTWSGTFLVLGALGELNASCIIKLSRSINISVNSNPTAYLAQLSGYIARALSTQDACNRAAYGVQSVFLLLGPSLIMFSVNIIQTDFARAMDASHFCFIPIKWQFPLYLTLNTVLVFLQAIGGIMTVTSTSSTTIATGTKMTIAIYVVQLLFWGVAFADNIFMTIRLRRQPTKPATDSLAKWKMWNQLFGLSTSIIAFGRNVMRLTMAGGIAFLVNNEWPSYAFDGYQMVVVLGAWAIWYLPEKCVTIRSTQRYHTLTRLESPRERHDDIPV